MAFEYFPVSANATNNLIFVPVIDLPGVIASQLDSTNSANTAQVLQGRTMFGLLKQIYNIISPSTFNSLGISVSNSESSAAVGITNRNYGITVQYLANIVSGIVGMIPVPTSGTNSGIGKFALTDIFPNAVLVASGAATGGAGIGIEAADLTAAGAPAYASMNIASGQDNREYLAAFALWACNGGLTTRVSGTTTSAITTASVGNDVISSLPTNATVATNPTTGVNASAANNIIVASTTYSFTIQTKDNQANDTFDVYVA